jgi:WD40 repeat protein
MSEVVPITTPIRVYQEDHERIIKTVAVFPHKPHMVTGSGTTLRLWDLRDILVLKEMEGHRSDVHAVAVSRDGRLIASGDQEGKLIAWHGKTGEPLTKPYECIDAHSERISSLDFSPDCTMMASGSLDLTIKLWSTETWQVRGDPIRCGDLVRCIRYSPSGEFIAIATALNIAIYDSNTRNSVANLKDPTSFNVSLVWTPDSTCLLSAGDHRDPTIREWDTSTWTQVGDSWTGHTEAITAIAVNFDGTMIASASHDNHVHLWQLSDRRTIAIFKHSDSVNCVTFSMDGRHILSGGDDKKISEWEAEVCRALIIGVEKVNGFSFPTLPQAHADVLQMRDFLVNSRDYLPNNIVTMMHHNSVLPELYPSRKNILREIDIMVERTSPHDHLFFYYTGHGDQVTCRHSTESDGKDEAILTYTGKRIIDNVLKEHLVDPLPQSAKLFALLDCSHSHTMLDLEHYECNELWPAPFKVLSGMGRKTKSFGESPSANFLKDSSEGRSSINDGSQTKFGSLATDNMGLGPRTSSPDTFLPKCTLDCPLTLSGERDKAHVVSLSACRENELAYDDNATGETLTKFFIEYLERNPEASYHDLLSYIRHKVDEITSRRIRETNSLPDLRVLGKYKDKKENEDSTSSSQRPSYSSHYRLDMLQMVDL